MGWRFCFFALLLSASFSSTIWGQILYGLTDTNLVTIDPTNPNNITIIGPHLLPAGFLPADLTYDPITDRLIGTVRPGGTAVDPDRVYSFIRSTGQATSLSTIIDPTDAFLWESLEFVGGTRNQIILSRAPSTGPQMSVSAQFTVLNPDTGATVPLVNNSRDNDFSVWDSRRNRFYAYDPNNSTSPFIYEVNLITGANTNFISISSSATNGPGEVAYSPSLDAFFAVDFADSDPDFFRINLNPSTGNPASLTLVGQIPGPHVFALAFVPEPTSILLLCLAACMARRRLRARSLRMPHGIAARRASPHAYSLHV